MVGLTRFGQIDEPLKRLHGLDRGRAVDTVGGQVDPGHDVQHSLQHGDLDPLIALDERR